VIGLPSRTPSRSRAVPEPTKHWGLRNTRIASPAVLCQLELRAWSEPRDSPWGIPSVPSPTGTMEPLQHQPQRHSPESFCFDGSQNPKSSAGEPVGRCRGDPHSRTHLADVTLQGYIPESRKRTCLGFTLCMGLACLEKGPGAPRPAHTPPSPLFLLKRKEELKMKLKHNSIQSGSRVKSSALIVCWQALPALQQTQCYQGTEGRFVCTGRASCCVRPACPGPGEHWDARTRTGAARGSGWQAAPLQHGQGAQPRDGVLWLAAASRLPAQRSGRGSQVRSLLVDATME